MKYHSYKTMLFKKWIKNKADSWNDTRTQNLIGSTLSKAHNSVRSKTLLLFDLINFTAPNYQHLLANHLKKNPGDQAKILNMTSELLVELDVTEFFSDYGLIEAQGFLTELSERILFRFLPEYQDTTRFSTICELYLQKKSTDKNLNPDHLVAFAQMLGLVQVNNQLTAQVKEKFSFAIHQSLQILHIRLISLVMDPNFRKHLPLHSRYVVLSMQKNDLDSLTHKISLLLAETSNSLQRSGVSIELVFRIERIKEVLDRMSALQPFADKFENIADAKALISEVMRSNRAKRSIRHFLEKNLSLISKNIVDRASMSGEHYIARSWREYRHLFFAAAGGGLLTVLTILAKSAITYSNFPLFIEGCFTWFNYSFSFYLMQLFGLTLATKTPALTAPVLAAQIKKIADKDSEEKFITEALHVIKSGFLAAVGNVVFVIIGAILINQLHTIYFGSQILSPETALKYFDAHNPFGSLTIWYAIYTGAVLWLGSALGGWFENWFVFRKLPQAIAESDRLNRIFGETLSLRISKWLSSGVMAFAINISLGFLLAFSTIWGKFFGLPLDVRHVTLSSGTLAFSLVGLQDITSNIGLILLALVSIFLIGFFNFSVSFVISLVVAASAKEVELKEYPHLLKLILKRTRT